MNLTNFLIREATIPRLPITAAGIRPDDADGVTHVKEQVVAEMAGSLLNAGCFPAGELPGVIRAVMERERIGTTGIGHGIAIPHTRHPSVKQLIGALALADKGLPFRSLDNEPAHVFVLLLSPHDQPGAHLRALEAVVRTMDDADFVRKLRSCQTPDEIWKLLETAAPPCW